MRVVAARTALLLVLRDGPGYGRELVRRIHRATAGWKRFAEGSIYPALRKLEAARLIRSWTVVPGRQRGGRARTYYELTERGVRAAQDERARLWRTVAGEPSAPASPEERERMRQRLELGAALSESAGEFELQPQKPRRRVV